MAIGTDTGLYYCTNELDIILLQAGSVAALAATDHYLALSDGKRLHLVTTEKKRCHVTHTINLPDIVQLLSARNNVFALAGGQVWRLQDKTIIEVGLRADRLAPFQGNYVAACKAGRTMILDPEGREVMEYTGTPWLVNVLEWPYMAVELDYPLNTLNLFARFPTLINAPEALKRVPDLSQNSN